MEFALKDPLAEFSLDQIVLAAVLLKLDVVPEGVFWCVPEARAADGDPFPEEGVVLDEVDGGGELGNHLLEGAPPEVVVALEQEFGSGKAVDPFKIGQGVLELHSPGDITGNQNKIVRGD